MNYNEVINQLLDACVSAHKDYERVFSGRGAPSVLVMNKLEAAIAAVKDHK